MKNFFRLFTILLIGGVALAQSGNFESYGEEPHRIMISSDNGTRLRLSFYSDAVVRFQWARPGENFIPDDHYEMVARHVLNGRYQVVGDGEKLQVLLGGENPVRIEIDKHPLRYRIYAPWQGKPLLAEKLGTVWEGGTIASDFAPDPDEHFCGLGHRSFGMVESLDLRGRTVSSNYGEGMKDWGAQGVLTVPFYLSGKGYGVFLNSTFPHRFCFGENGEYRFRIDSKGFPAQMDYFVILGPDFRSILDHYTALTGRPRLPQKSIFGLQLSDKGSPQHRGAKWWQEKITAHRAAGFPFDHIVNDNRWRAGSGAWSGSWFEWDASRTPDPAAFGAWCREQHLTMTLDLNRNVTAACQGWDPAFNLPGAEQVVKEGFSAPDYSNPAMRNWIWEMFWKKSFDPALGYPGDALWIDETDEMWPLPDSTVCADGRSWAENENYYPFLIAKAIVAEGWDNSNNNTPPGIGESKRPYVWMRSMVAGAQRYATYWTGDTPANCDFMRYAVRAMQVAGLGGFPFFNHDAGGFREPGPADFLYIQWAMGLGSFSPIWRPHGIGENRRWPLDREGAAREAARQYGKMRYEMMPYLYSMAHQARQSGLPMARAMVIDYRDQAEAWARDLQYMWGDAFLVAPVCAEQDSTAEVWLPGGADWYDYWTREKVPGNQVLRGPAAVGKIPLWVKAGAIVPTHPYAQSTAELDPSQLILNLYTGGEGTFTLYEDDGVSERFRTRAELRSTTI
ncbi:MAG TPA: glycoside hydrolase family 31 protein, partial [Calditrichia bacterium]|nr:glycoside hydrolase family 31 protein [Calditrichia bacterium]